ncbi:MAG: CcmD family protein [Bacteroidetes bacterium]|jgi:uncharacterized membrane protein|nr:CcmD family protein [Bacteroidota bacterium]
MGVPLAALAEYEPVSWDQTFRQSGKIYVVLAVVLLILLSLLAYLFTQERRIAKMEKELNQKKP